MGLDIERWRAYFEGLSQGLPKATAARQAGLSELTVYDFHNKLRGGNTTHYAYALYRTLMFGYGDLSDDAQRGLVDFEFFRRRFFGHISTPWQVDAAEIIAQLLETSEKEFVVINAPPGTGKSTLFTHDIPVWCATRDRSLRCLLGHRVERQARLYVNRVKRTLETFVPPRAEPGEIRLGLAIDAVSTLSRDYGPFKPDDPDRWRADELVIAQHDGMPVREKESTFTAYGQNSGVIGSRFDLEVWDDLVDLQNTRTPEMGEALVDFWDKVAERRLEPAGVLILQGQRLAARDLYRYALDKKVTEIVGDTERVTPLYTHIVFKAHDTTRCENRHDPEAPPQPKGCLLDPRRLTWKELEPLAREKPDEYATVYQQEDSDPGSVLVNPLWITGGVHPETHEIFPGCLDTDRRAWELPRDRLNPSGPTDLYPLIAADPSPSKWWSVQAWIYRVEPQTAWLVGHQRAKMDAPHLLDWVHHENRYDGLLEQWWHNFIELGLTLNHVIVEINAAQKFLLQYDHVYRWMRDRKVTFISHTTGVNKSDPDLGIDTLKSEYKHGRYRLPGHIDAARDIKPLVQELTHYPDWPTDDCVMANWFLRWNAQRLFTPRKRDRKALPRPSWVREKARRGLVRQ
jgi:hypothetical protein